MDLVIVGAGPAGMSAAIVARGYGLNVMVVDEQPRPGGQIWRDIEAVAGTQRAEILGSAYTDGLSVARQFRECGARFLPETRVWQVEAGGRVFMASSGRAETVEASAVLLATGAQERPVPFPGWTLPGVMTVGAGQILLKASGQIPDTPVWIAGCGPLALLYAVQLLRAGGRIAGFLDTTSSGRWAENAAPLLRASVAAPFELLKGLGWLTQLYRKARVVRNVVGIEAHGNDTLERLTYTRSGGGTVTVEARLLLVHEGLIPAIHPTLSIGCEHAWNSDQDSYSPQVDPWGETSESGIFVAGDGAGIAGAKAAVLRGRISAIGIAARLGRLSPIEADRQAKPLRADLKRALAARPFLDRYYRPRGAALSPADEALACRCEEVSAAKIRAMAQSGRPDPNRIKTFTRAGMGPCQGRQCNYAIANILAENGERAVADIGLYRVRPPFKPLTLGELSTLCARDNAS